MNLGTNYGAMLQNVWKTQRRKSYWFTLWPNEHQERTSNRNLCFSLKA